MKNIKSPFLWAGNKFKYLDKFMPYFRDRHYDAAIDWFMGTGNLLFNCNFADKKIGNDIIPLMPKIYEHIRKEAVDRDLISSIIKKWYGFGTKELYYQFRTVWNKRWLQIYSGKKEVNDIFVVMTYLLTKMCSNSMVRFNKKMEFNQGFRGTEGPFFSEHQIKNMRYEFQRFCENLFISGEQYEFYHVDFAEVPLDYHYFLFVDPPYLIQNDFYTQSYNKDDEIRLLEFLNQYFNDFDFVMFNFLSWKSGDDVKYHDALDDFIFDHHKDLKVIPLRTKTTTGQGRIGVSEVEEVVIIKRGEL